MDANAAVEELRSFYNNWQDNNLTDQDAASMVELFDDLDTHLMNGGELPEDWQR